MKLSSLILSLILVSLLASRAAQSQSGTQSGPQLISILSPAVGGEFSAAFVREISQAFQVQTGKEPRPEDIAAVLNHLTIGLINEGQYTEAEHIARQSLAYGKLILGQKHPSTISSVSNLAELYRAQGRYEEAEPLHQHALQTFEEVLGKENRNTLSSMNNLALLYQAQGRYGAAESLFQRTLKVSKRVLGEKHPQTLINVNNLAFLYESQGRYEKAEPLYQRTFKTRQQVLGRNHPDTLNSVGNLATLYAAQGRYRDAESLHQHALKTRRQVLGRDHPDTLLSANNLAMLYYAQGRYGEAESLLQHAFEGRLRTLGKEHPSTLGSVNNLATLYQTQRRYGAAESLYQYTLRTFERVIGRNHPKTLNSLNSLALVYQLQGRHKAAEPLYRRSIKAFEQVLGKEHPNTLTSVNNLAALYEAQGRHEEAEFLYQRTLGIQERVLGTEHPDTLVSINNLANLYYAQGRHKEAKSLYRCVLESGERVLGTNHPNTLVVQLNLAILQVNVGNIDKARKELRSMDQRLRHFVDTQFNTTLVELVRRGWLASMSNFQDVVFSLALGHPSAKTQHLAADVLLGWKRLAGENEAIAARLARTSRDPKARELASGLTNARAHLSHLMNRPDPDLDAIAKAQNKLGKLEVELAELSEEFQDHLKARRVDWAAVRSMLPAGSALLSLRAFASIDFKTGKTGELHWLAMLIPAASGDEENDKPTILLKDLGPLAPITAAQNRLRRTNTKKYAQALYQKLFGKLDRELAKYPHLYIAPDGLLDLISFDRLVLPDGRYWTERQHLHRIRVGRDLLRRESAGNDSTNLVAFGGIDYGKVTEEAADTKRQRAPVEETSIAQLLEQNPDGLLAANQRLRTERGAFKILSATGREADTVARIYREHQGHKTKVWYGRDATESRLKALLAPSKTPPRVLHLATHGFFLEDNTAGKERPLTLSGLALAGANEGLSGNASPTGEDGILYALEAQDLNLEGTELVVLSACDTGHGEVDYSEGVYGLARSFHIAGARNVLMSLWPLDDALAAEFMEDFYAEWLGEPGQSPADALHETRLAWIDSEDERKRDPRYWAPYVLVE